MSNIIHDPLTYEQKQQIYTYIYDEYFKGKDNSGPRIDAIYKPYFGTPYCAPYLDRVKKIFDFQESFWEQNKWLFGLEKDSESRGKDLLGEEPFAELQEAIKDPRIKAAALGIDPNNLSQVYAARIFIKAIIKCDNPHKLEEVTVKYARKIAGKTGRMTDKNRLLIVNDPVQKLGPNPSSLDIVLANTHFQTPHFRNVPTKFAREQSKGLIKRKLCSLYTDPEKRYLIDCLAALIRTEKGQVLISDCKNSLGELATDKLEESSISGKYNGHHTLFISSMQSPRSLGIFGHELLHMLFDHIPFFFEFFRDPLDKAIQKDRELRKDLDFEKLDKHERIAYESVEKQLEKNKDYFPNGYDSRNISLMHIEAIVRPMQNLIDGVPPAALEKVMPNLWAFYRNQALPALKAFYLE